MSIDYEVIKEALNPDTHKKISDQVGEELSETIRKYENGIRNKKRIDNVEGFTSDLRKAIAKVLARHLKMEKTGDAVNSLADSISDGVFQTYFGFSADEAKRRFSDMTIDNYDDFAHDYINTTRTAAVRQVQQHGLTGVQQHVQNPASRPAFFELSERDLGSGYRWTEHAKTQSDDYVHIANMLSTGIGGRMSQDEAKRSKKHVQYAGR